MKKAIIKLGAIMLSLILVFSLAACGSTGETKDSGSANEVTTDQQDSSSETAAAQGQQASTQGQQTDPAQEETTSSESSSESDVLVVYFSRTGEQYNVGVIDKGNTAIVAGMIVERIGADSFEILPEEDYYPYTYDELTDVAKREQSENARPAYAGEVPDLTQYSTIFIGARCGGATGR